MLDLRLLKGEDADDDSDAAEQDDDAANGTTHVEGDDYVTTVLK